MEKYARQPHLRQVGMEQDMKREERKKKTCGALLLLGWETVPLHTKKLTGPWPRTHKIGSILGLNTEFVL